MFDAGKAAALFTAAIFVSSRATHKIHLCKDYFAPD